MWLQPLSLFARQKNSIATYEKESKYIQTEIWIYVLTKLASKKFQNHSMAVFDIHLSADLVALNIAHHLFELNKKYLNLKARLDIQTRED